MAEKRRPTRKMGPVVLGVALLGLVGAGLLLWSRADDRPRPATSLEPSAALEEAGRGESPPHAAPATRPTRKGRAKADPASPGPGSLDDLADPAVAWSKVDLDAVRAQMPENLYWKLSMPTKDAALLREREAVRGYWEQQYGKVLSNTATEEEVRVYYAHRQRLSADSVEFATHLLDHYGDVLPERDVGLLELARELHLARLEEYPRNLSDALERREAHEAARRAWLEDQARFERAEEPPAD
jgi:hypothetical protein